MIELCIILFTPFQYDDHLCHFFYSFFFHSRRSSATNLRNFHDYLLFIICNYTFILNESFWGKINCIKITAVKFPKKKKILSKTSFKLHAQIDQISETNEKKNSQTGFTFFCTFRHEWKQRTKNLMHHWLISKQVMNVQEKARILWQMFLLFFFVS